MSRKVDKETFQFGIWQTPFENEWVNVLDCSYSASTDQLVIRVGTDGGVVYRVTAEATAFRVMDEGGLVEFWNKTTEFGHRPALATFKVKNSHWAKESVIPFQSSDGWSYVLATQSTCIDFATIEGNTPAVAIEH
jgi:hypothetical protein